MPKAATLPIIIVKLKIKFSLFFITIMNIYKSDAINVIQLNNFLYRLMDTTKMINLNWLYSYREWKKRYTHGYKYCCDDKLELIKENLSNIKWHYRWKIVCLLQTKRYIMPDLPNSNILFICKWIIYKLYIIKIIYNKNKCNKINNEK